MGHIVNRVIRDSPFDMCKGTTFFRPLQQLAGETVGENAKVTIQAPSISIITIEGSVFDGRMM